MTHVYNDGGRSRYTTIPGKHDCVVRAMAIAIGCDYIDMYNTIKVIAPNMASEGVNIGDPRLHQLLRSHGFTYVPGVCDMQGIPAGRVIAHTQGHFTAIIDGAINDVRDESYKAVAGYWVKGKTFNLFREGTTYPINAGPLSGPTAIVMRGTLNQYRPDGPFIHLKAS